MNVRIHTAAWAFALGAVALSASPSGAQPAASSSAAGPDVAPRIAAYRDVSGTMTLEDVRRMRFAPYDRFASVASGRYADLFVDGAMWLRFQAPHSGTSYVLLPPSVRSGTAYAVHRDGARSNTPIGTVIPVDSRPLHTDENIAVLPTAATGTVFYLRITPAASAIGSIEVLSPRGFADRERQHVEHVLLPTTFFVGALVALAVMGVMLGIVLRHRAYVFYACTLGAFALADSIDAGTAARWLWPHVAVPQDALSFIVRHVYDGLLLLFCVTMGGSQRTMGLRQRIAIGAYAALFVTGDLYQLWPSVVAASGLYAVLDPLANALFLSAAFVAAAPVTRSLSARNIAILGAFGLTLIGISLGRASACGLIAPSAFTADAPAIALILQALILAGAFAKRVERVEAAQADLAKERSVLEDAAMRDVLTGVPNRRAFDQRLDEVWRKAGRLEMEISIILIDVDHFKLYNDTFGHTFGDEVLADVARTIAVGLRGKEDFVARYGGEEFIVILPSCVAEEAASIAERLRADVEALCILNPAAPGGMLTISAGTASASPGRYRRASSLVEKADSALYLAKRTGRNRVSVSGSAIGAATNASHAAG